MKCELYIFLKQFFQVPTDLPDRVLTNFKESVLLSMSLASLGTNATTSSDSKSESCSVESEMCCNTDSNSAKFVLEMLVVLVFSDDASM